MRLIQYAVRSYIKPRPEQYLVQFAPTEVVTHIQNRGSKIVQVATPHAAVKPSRHVEWRGGPPTARLSHPLGAPRPPGRAAAPPPPPPTTPPRPRSHLAAGAPPPHP